MRPSQVSSPSAETASKEALRQRYRAASASASASASGPGQASPGKLAQQLRAMAAYRRARRIFVSPTPLLQQVRINALVDGKELLLPSPAMQDGFYLFFPFTIPFPKLSNAVTLKGMSSYGRKLSTAQLAGQGLELLVTEALAVDREGVMLADGHGFFDLAAAILATSGALAPEVAVVAAAPSAAEVFSVQALPAAAWDIKANWRLAATGPSPCQAAATSPGNWPIFWEYLQPVRIRRLTPLWQLRETTAAGPA